MATSCSTVTSDGTGTRNLGVGYPHYCCGEIGRRQVEQGFTSFFATFLPYLMIKKSGVSEL